MKHIRLLFLVGLFAFAYEGNAQLLKPLPNLFDRGGKYNLENVFLPKQQMGVVGNDLVSSTFEYNLPTVTTQYNLKCTLPKGAIFCRMEDAIYNHLNFWVKFRMGTGMIDTAIE